MPFILTQTSLFTQIGQLKLLRGLCVERDPDLAVTIRKLAMESFVLVMKDIAPRSVGSSVTIFVGLQLLRWPPLTCMNRFLVPALFLMKLCD